MSEQAKKKIVFYDTDKRHADLKIRLHYDGLTQSSFFRSMITAYLDKDAAMMDYISRLKALNGIHSGKKRRDSESLLQEAENTKTKFSIFEDDEVENIFDLIEEEHPDL
jgi:hypothetical protein